MQRGVQLVLKYLIIVVKRALRVREVEKLIMCETKEKGSSRKSYGHTNVLVDMMQNYPGFMDYIAYQYPLEGERIELLEQILTALAVGRKAGSGADDLSLWQYDSREGSHCEAGFSVAFGDGRIQQT